MCRGLRERERRTVKRRQSQTDDERLQILKFSFSSGLYKKKKKNSLGESDKQCKTHTKKGNFVAFGDIKIQTVVWVASLPRVSVKPLQLQTPESKHSSGPAVLLPVGTKGRSDKSNQWERLKSVFRRRPCRRFTSATSSSCVRTSQDVSVEEEEEGKQRLLSH